MEQVKGNGSASSESGWSLSRPAPSLFCWVSENVVAEEDEIVKWSWMMDYSVDPKEAAAWDKRRDRDL